MLNIEVLKHVAVLLISSFVLIYSGMLVIKSLVRIAYKMNIKEYVLSFVLLSFSTSIPELFVGISSAIAKTPQLSFGNIIGANIIDVTLIAGLGAIIARKIPISDGTVNKSSIYMVGIVSLMILLALFGNGLSRLDGIILLIVFFVYMAGIIKNRKKEGIKLGHVAEEEITSEENVKNKRKKIIESLWFNFLVFGFAMALIFFSAKFVTNSSLSLGQDLNLAVVVVGMVIVSLGTTLPELVLEIRIALAKQWEMSFADLIGSSIVNGAFVLGIVSIIHPIKIYSGEFFISAMFMIAFSALLAVMLNVKKSVNWKEGLLLVMLYIIFIIVQLNPGMLGI